MSLIIYLPTLSTFTFVQVNASNIKVTNCIRRLRFSPNSQSFWDRLIRPFLHFLSSPDFCLWAVLLFPSNFQGKGGLCKTSSFNLSTCKPLWKNAMCYTIIFRDIEHFIFRFLCGLQLSILCRLIIAQEIQSCLKMTGALFEIKAIRNSLLI